MSSPSLETVYRKMRRAEKHLRALTGELRAYDESGFYSVTDEIDPEDGSRVYRFHLIHEPDPEWEITIGEIAYQVRSALDQLVTQMVILQGGDADSHKGGFPIFTNGDDYWDLNVRAGGGKKVNRRYVLTKGISTKHRTFIDSLQPYQRGRRMAKHDPLAVLNDLCNGDKHRISHPAVLVRRESALEFNPNSVGAVRWHERSSNAPEARLYPLQDGAEMLRFSRITHPDGTSELPVNVQAGMFRIGVCFGKRQVFVFDLQRIIDYVEQDVIVRVAPDF